MDDIIFREYDIRGKIGSELNIDEVYDIACAITYYFVQNKPTIKTVVVGADGRTHSPAIKQEVCRALQDCGLDVIAIDPCPTPVVYFSLFTMPVDAGIMITASHNTKEYNGFKICLGTESVWGKSIQEIKNLTHAKAHVKNGIRGTYIEQNGIQPYIDWLVDHFSHLIGMDLSVLIDCGNGAGGTVFPRLIQAMKWQSVDLLYPEVDGTYPNHEADPIVEENMAELKKKVMAGPYDLGIGLDGDCDRMAPMTKSGILISGDKLLSLFSKGILSHNPGARIVFDIKCSSGLSDLIKHWGGIPHMSASGHSIIKDQLRRHKAVLAGELSCHFFFNDRYFGYDDAIYAALRLFELLVQSGSTLDDLLKLFPEKHATPEFRVACQQGLMNEVVAQVKDHFSQRHDVALITIDGVRVETSYGWGMIRASNTQPVLCLRFESDTIDGLHSIKNDFIAALAGYPQAEILAQVQ